jgi:hypothetical protein
MNIKKGTSETIRENLKFKNFNSSYNFSNFSYWFVGFFEANGCFSINIFNEIQFEIFLNNQDKDLLYKIKTYIQSGIVFSPPNSNISTLIIKRPSELISKIYPILNGKILSEYKYKQFQRVCDLQGLPPAVRGNHKDPA